MASLLSNARIMAEGSTQSIIRLKIYTLPLWKKQSIRAHQHTFISQRIISQAPLYLRIEKNLVYMAEIQHGVINNSHWQRPKPRP